MQPAPGGGRRAAAPGQRQPGFPNPRTQASSIKSLALDGSFSLVDLNTGDIDEHPRGACARHQPSLPRDERRRRAVFEGELANHSAADRLLHGRLPRPHQHRLRAAADEAGADASAMRVYGLGAGIFFIGYFLFEVPSNLLLEKIGARKTLLRIMFCWGIVAAAMMFVQTPTQFYVAALPARRVRGRLLPRHHPVPHLLVSVDAARPDDRHLHGGHHRRERHRRPAVRRAS